MDITLNLKRILLIVSLLVCMFGISQSNIDDTLHYDGRARENLEMLKEFAFCKCIYQGYKKDSVKIKDYSSTSLYEYIAGVAEMGDKLPKELSDYAKEFADSLKPSIYSDYLGARGISINCLKFYRSKMLESYIKLLMIKHKIPLEGNIPNKNYAE